MTWKLCIKLISHLRESRQEVRDELKRSKEKYKGLVSHYLEMKGKLQSRIDERDKEIKRYQMYFNNLDMSYKG